MTYTIRHPKGLVVSNQETIRNFRVRAEVELDCTLLAAFQMFHPEGKDFWVVAAFDEDNGAYATTWIDGDFSGWVFFEHVPFTGESPEPSKLAACAAAFGYAFAYCEAHP